MSRPLLSLSIPPSVAGSTLVRVPPPCLILVAGVADPDCRQSLLIAGKEYVERNQAPLVVREHLAQRRRVDVGIPHHQAIGSTFNSDIGSLLTRK